MARSNWLNQILGGIAGGGKGIELQQQYRRQREQDVQDKEFHSARMEGLRSEANSRRLRDIAESRKSGIVPLEQPGQVRYGQQQLDDEHVYDPSVTDEGQRLTEISGAFPTLSPAMQKLVAARPELIPHIQGGAFTKPEAPQRHYDSERGGFVDPATGTFTAIPGLPAKPTKDPVARFSPITTTDAEGNQHVSRFNNLTGNVEDTGVGAKQSGTGGGGAAALTTTRLATASKQASDAHRAMSTFESGVLDGTERLSATEMALARTALKGDPVKSSYAEGLLNKMNARLFQYVRSAKAIATAERLITPRGGSNALMGAEAMLSGVGAGASAEQVQQAQAYRQALVEGLSAHGGSSHTSAAPPATTTAKPPLATRVQQLKGHGLSKAAARQQLMDEGYDLAGGGDE